MKKKNKKPSSARRLSLHMRPPERVGSDNIQADSSTASSEAADQ